VRRTFSLVSLLPVTVMRRRMGDGLGIPPNETAAGAGAVMVKNKGRGS